VAQGVAEDMPQDVAKDMGFKGPGGARPPLATSPLAPPLPLRSWRYAEMGAQLGSFQWHLARAVGKRVQGYFPGSGILAP